MATPRSRPTPSAATAGGRRGSSSPAGCRRQPVSGDQRRRRIYRAADRRRAPRTENPSAILRLRQPLLTPLSRHRIARREAGSCDSVSARGWEVTPLALRREWPACRPTALHRRRSRLRAGPAVRTAPQSPEFGPLRQLLGHRLEVQGHDLRSPVAAGRRPGVLQ